MPDNRAIASLLAKIPDLDKRGTIHGPTWSEAQKVLDPIVAMGPVGIDTLIGMLHDIDDGGDWKIRYVLHSLVMYAGRSEHAAFRTVLVRTLSEQLRGDRAKGVHRFVMQQLQLIADGSVSKTLGKGLLDKETYAEAAAALLAIEDGAAEQFRTALEKAPAGRPRATMIQALGTLRDSKAAAAIARHLGDDDADTRQLAAWALANIGSGDSVDAVIEAADAPANKVGYQRIKMNQACLLLAEWRLAAGDKRDASRIYQHLAKTRQGEGEQYIADLAKEALGKINA